MNMPKNSEKIKLVTPIVPTTTYQPHLGYSWRQIINIAMQHRREVFSVFPPRVLPEGKQPRGLAKQDGP